MVDPIGKAATAGVAGGAILALAEGVTPDPITMMYSLAVAVIGLAGLVFRQRRQVVPVVDKITNSNLMAKLEDMAYGRGGMFERLDKHGARLDHVEHVHFRGGSVTPNARS
jgi:hypothetical protein